MGKNKTKIQKARDEKINKPIKYPKPTKRTYNDMISKQKIIEYEPNIKLSKTFKPKIENESTDNILIKEDNTIKENDNNNNILDLFTVNSVDLRII